MTGQVWPRTIHEKDDGPRLASDDPIEKDDRPSLASDDPIEKDDGPSLASDDPIENSVDTEISEGCLLSRYTWISTIDLLN
jgi:hypothetical protein